MESGKCYENSTFEVDNTGEAVGFSGRAYAYTEGQGAAGITAYRLAKSMDLVGSEIFESIRYRLTDAQEVMNNDRPILNWSGYDYLEDIPVFQDVHFIDEYDEYGNVVQEHSASGVEEEHEWGHDATRRLTHTVLNRDDSQSRTFTYDELLRLEEETGFDGVTARYEYDGLGRLGHMYEEGELIQEVVRGCSRDNSDSYDSNNPNYVRAIAPGGLSPSTTMTSYYDGLGRLLQTPTSRRGK